MLTVPHDQGQDALCRTIHNSRRVQELLRGKTLMRWWARECMGVWDCAGRRGVEFSTRRDIAERGWGGRSRGAY